jgi:hypothetical protein
MAAAMSTSGADAFPWSWKECTLLRVFEVYEFFLALHTPRSEKSAERHSLKVDLKVSRRSSLPLGLSVLRNPNKPARACTRKTCLRARMTLSPTGVVRQMDRKA